MPEALDSRFPGPAGAPATLRGRVSSGYVVSLRWVAMVEVGEAAASPVVAAQVEAEASEGIDIQP